MLDEKSEANLEIAIVCLDKQDEVFYSVGVSRAYYSIFQATKYFLEKRSFDYKKFKKNDPIAKNQRDYAHGSIGIALKYFLQTNGFDCQDDLRFINDITTTFNKLYNWRRQGDYEERIIYKTILEVAVKRAKRFISGLKKFDR